jgi:hypothetical protein
MRTRQYEIRDLINDEMAIIICYDKVEAIKKCEEIENNGGIPSVRRFTIRENGTKISL